MMREKLLLRQLEVINTTRKQQLRMGKSTEQDLDSNIDFLCDNEQELLAAIRNFGRYQLTNLNLALQDVYLKNEDYIKPSDDHETMFKGLNQSGQEGQEGDEEEDGKESIVVDFSRHKSLMEHNAKLMNESIINITLKEAKELIKQAKMKREQPVPPLNLEELDDEVESSIADVVSSLEQTSLQTSEQQSNNKYSQTQQSTKQKRFKPKITINNCNGTINLRNIASLTINCTTDDKVQAQIPVRYPQQTPEDEDNQQDEEEASTSLNKYLTKSSQSKSKTLVESIVTSSTNTECTTPTSTTNTTTTPNSLSNYSSNNSSRSQSTKKQKSKKSSTKSEKLEKPEKSDKSSMENKPLKSNVAEAQENIVESSCSSSAAANEVTCDFYNRLLNEIKKSINQQQKVRTKFTTTNTTNSSTTASQNPDSSTFNDFMGDSTTGRRFVLKNFENLKIILEANSSGDEDSFHPVQIEQWLAEIISETDLEPMQNTDILEHSKIHNEDVQET